MENKNCCDPLLTREPYDVFKSGEYNDIPVIIGYCKKEGNLHEAFANLEGRKPIHTNFDEVVPYNLNLEPESQEFKEVANKIKEFYYKDSNDNNTAETYSIVSIKDMTL